SGATRITEVDPRGADAGTETFDREVDLSMVEHAEAELREIDEAFQRLERGGYGTCQECGRLIPDNRLEVVPATHYCIDHQQQSEVRAGVQLREVYSDPRLRS
ncbi:MAG TPA: TraR/DksA C4-type zinc finger protein, partial [Egibacteraceae bacterium]|nr:TraR/DksA C4-type zinc finger protein [Egibacteraceae bacterium]